MVVHSLTQCLWIPPAADPLARSLVHLPFGCGKPSQQQQRQTLQYARALNTAFAAMRFEYVVLTVLSSLRVQWTADDLLTSS
jgi:hypothetical protein